MSNEKWPQKTKIYDYLTNSLRYATWFIAFSAPIGWCIAFLCVAENWPIEWVSIPTIYGDEKSKQNPLDQIIGFPKMCIKARRMVRDKRKKNAS